MTKEQTLDTAVKWWVDKLRTAQPHDYGNDSLWGKFICSMMDARTEPVSEKQLKIFETELKKLLGEEIDRYLINGRFYVNHLISDYGPDMTLRNAADKAKIPAFNFPFKTSMIIQKSNRLSGDEFRIFVFDGYRADSKELTV